MKQETKPHMKNRFWCYRKKDGTVIGKFHVVLPVTLIERIHEDALQKGFTTRNKWFLNHLMKHFGMVPGEGLSTALADRFMVQAQREEPSQ